MNIATAMVSRRLKAAVLSAAVAGLLVVMSPARAQVRQSVPSPQDRAAFSQAQTLYAAGNLVDASAVLERLLQDSPRGALSAQVKMLLGNIRLHQNAYQDAVAVLTDVVEQETGTEGVDQARLDLAAAYVALGKPGRAVPVLETVADSTATADLRRQAYEMLITIVTQAGDSARAIRLLLGEATLPAEVVDPALVQAKIREVIAGAQDPVAMETMANQFADRFPGNLVLFRAAQIRGEHSDTFQQERLLHRFLALFPKDDRAAEARAQLEANQAQFRKFRYVIGLPLPYDGTLQPYAASVLKGAQLAIEQGREGLSDQFVGLATKDYAGDTNRLGAVADEMMRDSRCVAVIGPFLSKEISVLLPRAQRWRVPMVTPTATGPIPSNRYLFRTAVTGSVEGVAVAHYAMEHLGLRRFVVLAPEDRYHAEVVAAFTDEVKKQGGRIMFAATYEASTVDFGQQIKALRESDLKQEGKMVEPPPDASVAPGSPQPRPLYAPGFDAVFLPGDGETVGLLAAQLAYYDVNLPLLGTSGWNGRDVIKSGGRFMEGAMFVDAFFLEAPDPTVQQFVKQFRFRYREDPDLFAAQAYDAASVLIQALKAGGTSGDRLRDQLVAIKGYHGVSGLTAIGHDGEAERRLSWIQIKNGRFVPAL